MKSVTRSLILSIILWCSLANGDARQFPVLQRSEVQQPKPRVDFINFFQQFEQFQRDFNRTYPTATETLKRFMIFAKNLLTIADLGRTEIGTAEYGVTEMSDWTESEFLEKRANLDPTNLQQRFDTMEEAKLPDGFRAPDAFDWRNQGKVTPVKDQGQCGSCWAFSTVGNLENLCKIKYSENIILSEQQLIDCDNNSAGCDGGWMDNAVQSIMDKGGINTQASYPYEAKTGTCRFKNDAVGARVARNEKLKARDEAAMANYISGVSSTSNAINAKLLQNYKRGIINQPARNCNNANNAVNHAVVTVGYGKENGTPFWVIKNSWGSAWGEKGYARLKRGVNTCGMANYINSAVLKN